MIILSFFLKIPSIYSIDLWPTYFKPATNEDLAGLPGSVMPIGGNHYSHHEQTGYRVMGRWWKDA